MFNETIVMSKTVVIVKATSSSLSVTHFFDSEMEAEKSFDLSMDLEIDKSELIYSPEKDKNNGLSAWFKWDSKACNGKEIGRASCRERV